MELKREQFFDGEKVNTKNVISMVTQHPQEMERIITFVLGEVSSIGEYMGKKDSLDREYEHKLHKLKEEYNMPLDSNGR